MSGKGKGGGGDNGKKSADNKHLSDALNAARRASGARDQSDEAGVQQGLKETDAALARHQKEEAKARAEQERLDRLTRQTESSAAKAKDAGKPKPSSSGTQGTPAAGASGKKR